MDAWALRWVLAIIGIVLLVGIYLFGLHQARLRKRAAMETLTREEVDSAFIEDTQLREELDNLTRMLNEQDEVDSYEQININPAFEDDLPASELPAPELYIDEAVSTLDEGRVINYLLMHEDHRLITSEEIVNALGYTELVMNDQGLIECQEQGNTHFAIASLSPPGNFLKLEDLEFSTPGFNCFIDFERCDNPAESYEVMLKKIDELVRLLNIKVYLSNQELLTISDVTRARASFTHPE